MARPSKYDTAPQERAVRMYFERLEDGDISKAAARREIGELLGVKESTLRNWISGGSRTSPTPGRGRDSATSPSSSTPTRGRSSAGSSPR